MGTNTTQNRDNAVTKTKVKMMNFEREYFPNMVRANTKTPKKGDVQKSTDCAKKALQEFLMT